MTNKQTMDIELSELSQKFLENNSTSTPVDVLWKKFKAKGIRTLDNGVFSKLTSSVISQAWCYHDIRRLSTRNTEAYRKAHTFKNQTNWKRYKKIQKDTQRACRSAHNIYISYIVGEPDCNTRGSIPT